MVLSELIHRLDNQKILFEDFILQAEEWIVQSSHSEFQQELDEYLSERFPFLLVENEKINFDASSLASLPKNTLLSSRYWIEEKKSLAGVFYQYAAKSFDRKIDLEIYLLNPLYVNSDNIVDVLQREYFLSIRFEDPHLPQCLAATICTPIPFLVYRTRAGGTLKNYLDKKGGRLSLLDSKRIFESILEQLSLLHDELISHWNLSLYSFTISPKKRPFLNDFGYISRLRHLIEPSTQTLCFSAPEQLEDKYCDSKTDVYALGMLFYRMITGSFPFESKKHQDIIQWHLEGERDDLRFPVEISYELQGLIKRALSIEPTLRYETAADLLKAFRKTVSQNGWYRHSYPVLQLLQSKIEQDWILLGDKLVSGSAESLLKNGLATPSFKLHQGRILLECDPCAWLADDEVGDTIALLFQRESLEELKEVENTSIDQSLRAIKAIAKLGDLEYAKKELEKLIPLIQSTKTWLYITEIYQSAIPSTFNADISLEKAADAISSLEDTIQVALFLRWQCEDLRRAKNVIVAGIEKFGDGDDLISLAQAYTSILFDDVNRKQTLAKLIQKNKEDSIPKQIKKVEEYSQIFSTLPSIIRWGVYLEQQAKTTSDLKLLMSMWEYLNIKERIRALSNKRQSYLRNAILRLRSELVPYEIQLPLPSEPYTEEILDEFTQKVDFHASRGRRAKSLNDWARQFGVPLFSFKPPFHEKELNKAEAFKNEQEALLERLNLVLKKAKELGLPESDCPKPLDVDWIEQLNEHIMEQEGLAIELSILEAKVKEYSLVVDIPSLPTTSLFLKNFESSIEAMILKAEENKEEDELTNETTELDVAPAKDLETPSQSTNWYWLIILIAVSILGLVFVGLS